MLPTRARLIRAFGGSIKMEVKTLESKLEKEVKFHHEGRDSLEYKHHTILIHPLILQIDQNEYPQAQ